MTSDRLVNLSERWFRLLERSLSARLSRRHGRRGRGDVSRPRARRPAARRDPAPGAGVDERARGLAAQRSRRTRAARGLVAAQRQLGPRRGDRDPPAAARPCVRRGHDRHADHRTRHGRGRVHRRPQDPDRADAVPGCRGAVLRLARLWTDRRREAGRACRTGFHGTAEVRAPWSRTSRRSSRCSAGSSRCARAPTRARSR